MTECFCSFFLSAILFEYIFGLNLFVVWNISFRSASMYTKLVNEGRSWPRIRSFDLLLPRATRVITLSLSGNIIRSTLLPALPLSPSSRYLIRRVSGPREFPPYSDENSVLKRFNKSGSFVELIGANSRYAKFQPVAFNPPNAKSVSYFHEAGFERQD